jgi:hypothetical protein
MGYQVMSHKDPEKRRERIGKKAVQAQLSGINEAAGRRKEVI